MRYPTVRYLVVIGIGALVDLGVALALRLATGWPLWLCAAIGFVAASAANFWLFERWAFRSSRPQSARSDGVAGRLIGVYGAGLLTILTRIGVIGAVGLLGAGAGGAVFDAVRLFCAFVCSFLVNFLVVRRIYRAPTMREGAARTEKSR